MYQICGFVVLLALAAPQVMAEAVWHDELAKNLERNFKNAKLPDSGMGVYVSYQELGNDVVLWAMNEGSKMTPASLTKILTAGAAMSQFPSGHQFVTQLLYEKLPDSGVLKGPLYLKGGGNPSFVSEDMWVLVNHFTRAGITKIEGDIVVDDTLFDGERFDSGRDPDRVDRAYDSPIGAMSLNWNAVNVYVRSTEVGKPVQVFIDPAVDAIAIKNNAKSVRGDKKDIKVERITEGDRDTIVVSGTLGVGLAEIVIYKAITRPDLWSGEQLKSFLNQRGVVVTGKVRAGAAPALSLVAAEHKSKPVPHIVEDMMKWSNNYVAEMLTKGLAAANGEKPATMNGGINEIKKFLVSLGISESQFVVTSPSGLSRRNKIRPIDLHRVLGSIHNNFKIFPEFMASLPIAGVDGTLRDRMKSGPANGWVRAKTGLLAGIVGMAGYAGRPDGTLFTFVFVYNGKAEQMWAARDAFDILATTLVMGK